MANRSDFKRNRMYISYSFENELLLLSLFHMNSCLLIRPIQRHWWPCDSIKIGRSNMQSSAVQCSAVQCSAVIAGTMAGGFISPIIHTAGVVTKSTVLSFSIIVFTVNIIQCTVYC